MGAECRGMETQRELAEAVVGVIVRWRKRDIDAVFKAHPAAAAHEYWVSHGLVGNKEGSDSDFGRGCVTEESTRREVDSPNPDQLWSAVGRTADAIAALAVSTRSQTES